MTHKVHKFCKSKANVIYKKIHESNKLFHKTAVVITKRKTQHRVFKSPRLAAVPPTPAPPAFKNLNELIVSHFLGIYNFYNVSKNHHIPQRGSISQNIANKR